VEQAATGALHCQIVDAVFPGKVQLHKVNFDAKYEHEYVPNFKVLQDVFNKENISKHIPVDKLIKAKYQDNLEFLQWMKRFFDVKYGGQPYNAKERREQAKGGKSKQGPGPTVGAKKLPTTTTSAKPAPKKEEKKAPASSETKKPATKTAPATKLASNPTSKPTTKTQPKPAPTSITTTTTDSGEKDSSNVKTLNEEISKLNVTVEGLEKERNFYFDKLREIEILCQTEDEQHNGADAQALKQEILKILYATDDNEEFQSPDDQDKSIANGTKSAQTPPASTQSSSEKNLLEENVDDLLADLQDGAREESGATF